MNRYFLPFLCACGFGLVALTAQSAAACSDGGIDHCKCNDDCGSGQVCAQGNQNFCCPGHPWCPADAGVGLSCDQFDAGSPRVELCGRDAAVVDGPDAGSVSQMRNDGGEDGGSTDRPDSSRADDLDEDNGCSVGRVQSTDPGLGALFLLGLAGEACRRRKRRAGGRP